MAKRRNSKSKTPQRESGTAANRQYKDNVFTLLFREIALQLYCAVTGKQYDPNVKIYPATMTDILFRGRLNDLAFIVENKLVVLIEHQSTINPNMPIRMLFYIARVFDWYINETQPKGAIYGEKMLTLPRPEFIVLYNGRKAMPDGDRRTMKLSDMFAPEETSAEPQFGGLDLTVEMFNINKGHNPEMAARCKELDDYETFIQMARDNQAAGMPLGEAIRKAVSDCIDNNVLSEFLNRYKKEVVNMFASLEWNFEDELAVRSASAREEAREEERKDFARFLLSEGHDKEYVARATKLDVADIVLLQCEER